MQDITFTLPLRHLCVTFASRKKQQMKKPSIKTLRILALAIVLLSAANVFAQNNLKIFNTSHIVRTAGTSLPRQFTNGINCPPIDPINSEDKIKAEILYNKYDIFKKLFSWYMYASTILFVLIIVQIFKYRSKWLKIAINVLIGIIILLFAVHVGGLVWRWYMK